MKLRLTIFTLVVLGVFVVGVRAQATKTIILVRHAEKVDASQDPELSAEGKQRAERLVRAMDTRALAARLMADGGSRWERYQDLVQCERGTIR